jgi:hypothetical protein
MAVNLLGVYGGCDYNLQFAGCSCFIFLFSFLLLPIFGMVGAWQWLCRLQYLGGFVGGLASSLMSLCQIVAQFLI